MKTRFSKLLSVLLAFSMVLSVCGFTVLADETATTEPVYYVQHGATGDGTTLETPGSFATVIADINSKYDADDTVTIKIVRNESDKLASVTTSELSKLSHASIADISSHTAMLVVTSADPENLSRLVFVNTYTTEKDKGGNVNLTGPLTLKNIKLLDTRTNYYWEFYTEGNKFVLGEGTSWYRPTISNSTYKIEGQTWTGGFHAGTRSAKNFSAPAYMEFADRSFINSAEITYTGYHENHKMNFNEDATIKLGSGTAKKIVLSNIRDQYAIFKKNVNLVLDGTTVTAFKNRDTKAPVIYGALQIIKNGGSTITENTVLAYKDDAKTVPADVYDITVNEGIKLDVTGTAGTFSVDGEGVAYTVSEDGCTIYYGEETLTVPKAGVYTVNAAASVDDIIATVDQPKHEEIIYGFDKWEDDGTKLTAVFKLREVMPNTYFVQYGGKGDGRSIDSPVATVAEAVKLINADGLKAGDTATVYVMQSADWDYGLNSLKVGKIDGKNVAPEHHMTSWAGNDTITDAHKATINIIGYNFSETNRVYLAANSKLGNSAGMSVNGPVNFDKIILVDMRKAYRGISANGYDVTYGENCVFARVDNDMYAGSGAVWKGVSEANVVNADLGREYATSGGPGGTVIFKNVINTLETTRGVQLPSGTQTNYTFTDDLTVIFDNPAINVLFGFGAAKATNVATLQGNLNIIVENATKVQGSSAYNSSNTRGPVNVSGAVQSIGNNNKPAVMPTDNVTAKKGIYTLSSATNEVSLAITDTIGKYAVIGEKVAYAVAEGNAKIYYSVDGFLTVPAGNYTVYAAADVAGVKAAAPAVEAEEGKRFAGWTDVEGEAALVPAFVGISNNYYVKHGGTGSGRSAEFPLGSITGVVSLINADGLKAGDLATVYVIDSGEGAKCINKELINSDIILGYNAPATHTATIKYTSYSDTVTSVIGHVNFRGMNQNGDHLQIKGPSIFENINILDVRNSTAGSTDIYCNFYDVTFKDVIFMDLTNTTSYVYYPSSTHFSSGSIRNTTTMNRDSTVVLSNASVIGDYADMLGYTDNSKNQTLNGSATTKFESGTVKNLFLTNANALNTVNKNVNLVLGKNTKVATLKNTKTIPVIKGALQVVKNYGAVLPANETFYGYADSSKTTKTPYYEITSNSGDIYLDVTSDAGKYSVAGGVAYILSDDGLSFRVSVDGIFTVAGAGVYAVNGAASLEAVKAIAGTPEAEEGMQFAGWVEESAGKYVANFEKIPVTFEDGVVTVGADGSVVDFAQYETAKEGNIFLGWKAQDGTWLDLGAGTEITVDAGTYTAEYEAYTIDTPSSDIYVEGAQIRITDSQADGEAEKADLRYITRIKKEFLANEIIGIEDFDGGENIKYGHIVLPAEEAYRANGEMLEIGKATSAGIVPTQVPATKIYTNHGDYVRFTVCLTNISVEKYTRCFAVRPYIIYTDKNGVENVIYGEQYETASLVSVAELGKAEALANGVGVPAVVEAILSAVAK